MSLLASIGLIVSSPIVGEVVVVPGDLELKLERSKRSLILSCADRVERLAKDADSSVIAGAEQSVIKNFGRPECGDSRSIYSTNLVHRDERMVEQYEVVIAVPKKSKED